MEDRTSALIIGPPGQLRNSLRVLLTAIPRITGASLADDVPSALVAATHHYPTLILLDARAAGGELPAALEKIKSEWPQAKRVILVNNEREFQMAQAAGADKVLLKGCPADKLLETLEQLLSEQEP